MIERAQGHGVVISLPDDIEGPRRKIDRISREDLPRQIHQNSVAHFARVKKTDQRDRNIQRAAEVFEYSLTAETAHRVFPDRLWGIIFARPGASPLG